MGPRRLHCLALAVEHLSNLDCSLGCSFDFRAHGGLFLAGLPTSSPTSAKPFGAEEVDPASLCEDLSFLWSWEGRPSEGSPWVGVPTESPTVKGWSARPDGPAGGSGERPRAGGFGGCGAGFRPCSRD